MEKLIRLVPWGMVWILGLAFAAPGFAQDQEDQEELVVRQQKKLSSEFLKRASWLVDYDEARSRAKADGKLVFAYFTRSYEP